EFVRGDEVFDARKRQPPLLDVEQQIAALAGAEEIPGLGNGLKLRVQQVLPAAADIIRGQAVALLENEGAGGDDVTPRELAIESHMHEATRTQQREQRAPARWWIRKVVQNPAGLDQIERAINLS